MRYMDVDGFLFDEGLLEQVLYGGGQVAVVYGLHDPFGEFDEQRGGNIVVC